MESIVISLIIFAVVFGGSLLGMAYRSLLSEHHLNEDSKTFVLTIGLELAGVVAALVLALAVTGAQNSFNEQRKELMSISSQIIMVDQLLKEYGAESGEIRESLKSLLIRGLNTFWPKENDGNELSGLRLASTDGEPLYLMVMKLEPTSASQRLLKDEALRLSYDLEQTSNLLFVQNYKYIPKTFIIVLTLLAMWFLFIFFSIGIYAPLNTTVIIALVLSSLSIAIAFFMIIDLNLPFDGILRMPSAPVEEALRAIGK